MTHKTVYLIRHGMTPGNRERRYIGQRTDEVLLPESITKAEKAASELFKELENGSLRRLRLCSSPMKRAVTTAEIYAGAWRRTGSPDLDSAHICLIDALTEIDFGDFEGKNHEELQMDPRYQAWIDAGGKTPFPNGESREAFIERSMRGFLTALGNPDQEETVIIVCHGGTIMAVLSALTGEDYFSFMTEPLGGFRLELETEDERISALTYCRFAGRDPA